MVVRGTHAEDYLPAIQNNKIRSENIKQFNKQTFKSESNLDITDTTSVVELSDVEDGLPADHGAGSAVAMKAYLYQSTAVVSSTNTPEVQVFLSDSTSTGLTASTGTGGTAGLVRTGDVEDTAATPVDLVNGGSLTAGVGTAANGSAQGQLAVFVDVYYKG